MNILLFDGPERNHLLPFTFVRPVAHLRIGIDLLIDKWQAFLNSSCSVYTQTYLGNKFPATFETLNTFVNPSFIPTATLAAAILKLNENQAIHIQGQLIACVCSDNQPPRNLTGFDLMEWEEELLHLKSTTDLFNLNEFVLQQDFMRLTHGRSSAKIATTNQVISPENIFIEEGATVEHAFLNASKGPIYIGKNVEIMEGSMLRGSSAFCQGAVVKMGAKIYGGTTIGPFSKVGGELSNVLILGYSNKGHDGFLGNSIIGEWCNLGADTNTSNLKNNYSDIKTYSYKEKREIQTDVQFMGLFMGDYSKSGINTMFNTATVIGVSCNIFGSGFPAKHIPSFSWVNAQAIEPFDLDKSIKAANNMMIRRDLRMDLPDQDIFTHLSTLKS